MNSPKRALRGHPVRNTFIGLACLVIVLLSAGTVYQWVALRRDRRQNPMPGRLVDVDGQAMHIDCTGRGLPTVVLVPGLGATWLAWYKVQPLVAQFTRVCSYDPAGYGWSAPSPKPLLFKVMAESLHQLLQNAGIPSPYVLVGHSFGGMVVRLFAARYPDEADAVVLVDSSVPHEYRLLPRFLKTINRQFLRAQTWKMDMMFFGLPRLMGWCGTGPAAIRSELRTVNCRVGPWRVHLAEYDAFGESSDQVLAAGPLGNLPVVVISEDPNRPTIPGLFSRSEARSFSRDWSVLQAGLTKISTDSCRMIAKGSDHQIPSERPHLIVDVVDKLVGQLREPQKTHSTKLAVLLKQYGCVR